MKKTIMITALLVASVIAIASFASTAIAVDNKFVPLATIQVSGNGNTWQVNIGDLTDITDIEAVYWYSDGLGDFPEIDLLPDNVVINNNKIQLVFSTSTLGAIPASTTNGTRITFNSPDAPELITVSGPGFAWGRTR